MITRHTGVLRAASLALLVTLADCGGGGGGGLAGSNPMPGISVSSMSLSFGDQLTGTTAAQQTVTVTNTGTASLTISGVTITGSSASAFADSTQCSTVTVGNTCSIGVIFTPVALGAASATLSIASSAGSPTTVALSGSGSPAAGSNTLATIVDGGPPNTSVINILYATVTVCAPGSTTTCYPVDHVQVDTGSVGFRVLTGVLPNSVASALTPVTVAGGNALVECTQFVDGYSWGPIDVADLTMGGETAPGVRIQIIGDPTYANLVPAACSNMLSAENSVMQFGANGIIGVGNFLQDCGPDCYTDGSAYNSCSTTACTGYAATTDEQVPNPVGKLASDNNGVVIQLPPVPEAGAATLSGTLVLGIGTQSNNGLAAGATVYELEPNSGTFVTVFGGQTLSLSVADTGSNGYFFPNSSITPCGKTDPFYTFYCPASPVETSGTIQGYNGTVTPVKFTVTDPDATLMLTATAAPDLAGPLIGAETMETFDWGLPFFFGRTVYFAFQNSTVGTITGPSIAF